MSNIARTIGTAMLAVVVLASGCAQSGGFSVAVQDLQTEQNLRVDRAQPYPTSVFVPLGAQTSESNAGAETDSETATGAFEQALVAVATPLPTSVPPVRPEVVEPTVEIPVPTAVPPTAVPATAVPPTAVPPTAVPPTEPPATPIPPTAEPATPVPSTQVPPTPVPADDSEVALSASSGTTRAIASQTHAAFAAIGPLTLYLPSTRVEHVGFHQAVNSGAQQMTPIESPVPATQLASRGRGTGSHTAVDIVIEPGATIVSPVSGTVLAANTYVLYCEYDDSILVIEPDGLPGWETKLLHISGLQVSVGQRVEAGVTVIASGPTVFPFESQVDGFTSEPAWPHVHIETVDTSIPHEGSSGSCP